MAVDNFFLLLCLAVFRAINKLKLLCLAVFLLCLAVCQIKVIHILVKTHTKKSVLYK